VATPLSTLLRLLFPSWEFFDVARRPPALEVLVRHENRPTGVWQRVVYPPTRRWWHLVCNPAGTRTLAAQTIVERCYAELDRDDGDPAARQAAMTMVGALAESWVRRADASGQSRRPTTQRDDMDEPAIWQWRIIVHDDESGTTAVVYVSGIQTTGARAPRSGSTT
jgi:hypothetical protein